MCSEPLTYEQIWGEPGDDQLLEEMLVDDGDDDWTDYNEEPCMNCGQPPSLCICLGEEHFEG
jgi:hypothetical protein